MDILLSTLSFADNITVQALLTFPLLLSMVISYRCLQVPDVTMDGTSILAASVCVVLMKNLGMPLPVALVAAIAVGFLGGILTGILVEIFKINALLAGIMNAFVFYSIGLMLVGASLDFDNGTTIFSWLKENDRIFSQGLSSGLAVHPYMLCFILGIALILKVVVDWFLHREWGVALRGASSNDLFLQLRGVNTKRIRILGFGLANALVGFGATLTSMYEGSVQVARWPGTIIFALSVAIIGWEVSRQMLNRYHIQFNDSTSLIIGAFIYFLIVRVCYTFNAPVALPRLMIALYIILILAERKDALRRFRELL